MLKGVFLLLCSIGSGTGIAYLSHSERPFTPDQLLGISGLSLLAGLFLWNSLSYILLDFAVLKRHHQLLRVIAAVGSPKARRIAIGTLLLLPTPAYAAPLSDSTPVVVTSEFGRQIQRTPDSLRAHITKPRVLDEQTSIFTIQPGDSLWSIAEKIAPYSSPTETASLVKRIVAANPQISDPQLLYPGQQIILPPVERTL